MNKKGFTLVEILAVIALLGVVITIATTSIIGVQRKMSFQTTYEKIKDANALAATYVSQEENLIDVLDDASNTGKCVIVSWNKMIADGFYDAPDGKVMSDAEKGLELNSLTFCIYRSYSHYYSCIPEPSSSGTSYFKKNYDILNHLVDETDIATLYCPSEFKTGGKYKEVTDYNI